MSPRRLAIGCAAVVLLSSSAAAALIWDWADRYVVGWVYAEHFDQNDSWIGVEPAFSGWVPIGSQQIATPENAVSVLGALRWDNTPNDCDTKLGVWYARHRRVASGLHHPFGELCPDIGEIQTGYEFEGQASRVVDTCGWGNAATFVSSRTVELDHSVHSGGTGIYDYYGIISVEVTNGNTGYTNPSQRNTCYSIKWF